ncbi:uncharacterized protein LOC113475452 [Ciona intestinalis]
MTHNPLWCCGWVFLDHAQSGYTYESVNNSMIRFLPEPYFCNDTSIPGRSGAECSGTWYFWKLPPDQVTILTHAIVWLFYCLHQVFIWALIYRAQLTVSRRKDGKKYGSEMRWFNWSLLGVNAVFHILHLVQTHWTYDGTAQDVAISSSQASVIMMICFILLMEYRDRGFMLMWPNPSSDDKLAKYLRLHPGPIQLIRKYHGFIFSWATIYTFWYHPMENTWGHTFGFFHTAIVLLQGSLIYTDMHLNRLFIAVQTSNPTVAGGSSLWPIFTFGFGFVLAFTQVFSFPFWKKISPYFRIIPVLIFFTIVLALCGTVVEGKEPGQTGFSRIYEMFFIPAEEYMMLLFSWLFLYIFIRIEAAIIGDKKQDSNYEMSPTKQAFYLAGVVMVYAAFVLISYFWRFAHGDMLTLMIIFVFIFSFGCCITVMLFKQIMGPHRSMVRSACVGEASHTKFSESETAQPPNNSSVGNDNGVYEAESF